MKYYKDEQEAVYAFDADGSQDEYIPEGLVAISEKEANKLRFPPPSANDVIKSQIATLEASITDRMMREAIAGATNTFPADHPAWPSKTSAQAISAINAQIAELRVQLK